MEKSRLKPPTAELLPEWMSDSLCMSVEGSELIFFTGIFSDGFLIGFWSHSPWGNIHDQEQGWMLVSPDGKHAEDCETKTGGLPAGNDFKSWRSKLRLEHGKLTKLCDEFTGENIWKITDC